ncbi:MAG TPA: Dyp-type peroxidase [Candidatus Lustribacter sp.]
MSQPESQSGVLVDPPPLARSLTYRLHGPADAAATLRAFAAKIPADWVTVGIGEQVALRLGRPVAGLRTFPGISGPDATVPSTQGALWVLLRAADHTELYKREGSVRAALAGAFVLDDAGSLFHYDGGRDLSGFEDGTANPSGAAAAAAAIVHGSGALDGSSYVAVQRWIHDLQCFAAFSPDQADAVIGRRLVTNEEIADAPPSAHVKRTEQEGFGPETFVVRRSMPWSDGEEHGLEFIAFGDTLDKFERILRRMLGLDDGIVDALFTFSRPVRGGYYWCPPLRSGRLDLSALGIEG